MSVKPFRRVSPEERDRRRRIGYWVNRKRTELGIMQKDFAASIGVDAKTVHGVEMEFDRLVNRNLLGRMANALGVKPAELTRSIPKPKKRGRNPHRRGTYAWELWASLRRQERHPERYAGLQRRTPARFGRFVQA